ncbi:MAG: glycosyltransferase family 1 protein [Opitutales bacterium]|nr:glycosyltransferase family 1 protein [Opitutales bacterium]
MAGFCRNGLAVTRDMAVQRVNDIYVVVTHTSHTMDNTGIQRVTRSLCRALEEDYPAVSFVSWAEDLQCLRPLDVQQASRLGAYGGPVNTEPRTDLAHPPTWIGHLPVPRSIRRRIRESWRRKHAAFRIRRGGWMVIPEWVTGRQMEDLVAYAKRQGLGSVAIFHDAIALDYPELVSQKFRENHYEYLRSMTLCDQVIANSRHSFERFQRFIDEEGKGKPHLSYVELAGEIIGCSREAQANEDLSKGIRALCVGSLDPRKNHQALLDAFEIIWTEHPSLPLELTLVGGIYDENNPICRLVRDRCDRWPGLQWLGRVPDEVLSAEYQKCHLTCFPSVIEGFGLPIMESLWHGRPCVCSKDAVMGELASGGGCVATAVEDPVAMARAIHALVSDPKRLKALAHEALDRPIKTWRQYGREFVDQLRKPGTPE